ncbi:MAG: ribosome small subunit-dependent GTPase A [Clostridia bacterium]|nr:ribosome small subunit-dependent GTPase A [Clostridia bacterium]
MKDIMRGIVTRGVGGLYGVRLAERPEEEILCRARGILRQKKISPTVGDDVRVELADEADRREPLILPEEAHGRGSRMKRTEKKDRGVDVDYVIDTVEERRSLLIRPPVANLDILFVVIPCASPEPDLLTADKLTVIAENYGIETVIVVNKADLDPGKAAELSRIYGTAGYRVFPLSAARGEGVDTLRAYIRERALDTPAGGHVSGAFAGASGAGKSTLMTALFPDLRLETGSVSRKTERGRHTTRHVELWPMDMDGGIFWIADTPGFSMLDFTRFDFFPYDELASSFREFEDCLGKCRYTKCTHLREEGCAVIAKRDEGGIAASRHESYVRIFEEQRSVPEWKRRQNEGSR